eukprot:2696484-Pyramimonas_sp.AAC.1
MSPQSGGGGTELPVDPAQLRELRVRHFTQMDNARTTFMLDAEKPESKSFDLSDSSVATAATAVRA